MSYKETKAESILRYNEQIKAIEDILKTTYWIETPALSMNDATTVNYFKRGTTYPAKRTKYYRNQLNKELKYLKKRLWQIRTNQIKL